LAVCVRAKSTAPLGAHAHSQGRRAQAEGGVWASAHGRRTQLAEAGRLSLLPSECTLLSPTHGSCKGHACSTTRHVRQRARVLCAPRTPCRVLLALQGLVCYVADKPGCTAPKGARELRARVGQGTAAVLDTSRLWHRSVSGVNGVVAAARKAVQRAAVEGGGTLGSALLCIKPSTQRASNEVVTAGQVATMAAEGCLARAHERGLWLLTWLAHELKGGSAASSSAKLTKRWCNVQAYTVHCVTARSKHPTTTHIGRCDVTSGVTRHRLSAHSAQPAAACCLRLHTTAPRRHQRTTRPLQSTTPAPLAPSASHNTAHAMFSRRTLPPAARSARCCCRRCHSCSRAPRARLPRAVTRAVLSPHLRGRDEQAARVGADLDDLAHGAHGPLVLRLEARTWRARCVCVCVCVWVGGAVLVAAA
jgi:hypothetical protein